jgi:iron complex outermembrane receptor protein
MAMSRRRRSRRISRGACAALFAISGAAFPQQAEHAEQVIVNEGWDGSFRGDRVQVGTFRDMDPLQVPLTSNVVTRAVLDAQGATTLFGAVRNTAGVTRSQLSGSTYDNISIRGILVENRGNYRLNGSLPVINLVDVPLEDKERVEVLKGASTLYYGFVPPSGIVNFVTARAGSAPLAAVSAWGTSHGATGAHVDVARRFGMDGRFGARVNLVKAREDIGIDHYDGDRELQSAALDWRASDRLQLRLDLERYAKDVSEQAAIALLPAVDGAIALPPVPPNTRNLAGEWQRYDAEARNALLRGDLMLDDSWSLVIEAGRARTERRRLYSQFERYDLATGDGTLRIFPSVRQLWQNDNWRAELFGAFDTGRIVHELSLGYTANRRSQDSLSLAPVSVVQNLYAPVDIAPVELAGSGIPAISSIHDRGWYAFDRMRIGALEATLGVRGSRYSSGNATTSYRADEATPMAALLYRVTPRTSVYASYLVGMEESGQAPANRANAFELLPPAKSRQSELGLKARLAANALVQAALFQIERPSTFVDADNRFVLNGLARYRGLELAASGEITPEWALVASALFLDAEQRNGDNPATFGKTPENTPRHTASLFVSYAPRALPGFATSVGAFRVGAREVDNENRAQVGGYTTYSLGASYAFRYAGTSWRVQANVENLRDDDYWSSAGNGLLGVGMPRAVKVMLRAAW